MKVHAVVGTEERMYSRIAWRLANSEGWLMMPILKDNGGLSRRGELCHSGREFWVRKKCVGSRVPEGRVKLISEYDE